FLLTPCRIDCCQTDFDVEYEAAKKEDFYDAGISGRGDPMKRAKKSRQKYSDDDLIAILSDAPTRANAIKHAARFQRSPEAIELIYKWAMTPPGTIKKRG